MFDAPPPNLPVEPSATPAPAVPSTPPPPPIPPMPMASGKKEPEDIFSGLDKEPAQSGSSLPPIDQTGPRSSSLKIVFISLLLLVLLGGVGFTVWYFLVRAEPVEQPAQTTQPLDSGFENPPVVTAESEPIVETPIAQPEEPKAFLPPNVPLPQNVAPTSTPAKPGEAVDTDGDGLSNSEEELFGTSATMSDSDGDGFADAVEVKGGYDPTAPSKTLVQSAIFKLVRIKEKYTALIPASWETEGAAGSQFINTQTGANFQVTEYPMVDKPAGAATIDWAAQVLNVENSNELTAFKTKNGYSAWQTADKLSTFVLMPNSGFVIRYNISTAAQYEFRALYDLFIQTLGATI